MGRTLVDTLVGERTTLREVGASGQRLSHGHF